MTTSVRPVAGVGDQDLDLVARGQLIALTPGEYDWIHLRFASPVGEDDEPGGGERDEAVWLHYQGGVDPEWLRLRPGAGTCRIPVPRHDTLVALRLPDAPRLRVRGLTLIPAHRPAGSITDVKEASVHG